MHPFDMFAFICGFSGNKKLRMYIKSQQKTKIYNSVRQGITCKKELATDSGQSVLDSINDGHFLDGYDLIYELRLIFLVKENVDSEQLYIIISCLKQTKLNSSI